MASTIKTKSSNVASKVPTTAQIETGELAINFPDQKIYTKDPSGNIIEMAPGASYTNADVDTHLNYSTATTGQVLSYSGSDYDWVDAASGATGGGSDEVFYENGQNVTTNYTVTNNKNAMSAGPITINSGVTVTVGSGETWTVV